jgi:hypothetical protein
VEIVDCLLKVLFVWRKRLCRLSVSLALMLSLGCDGLGRVIKDLQL